MMVRNTVITILIFHNYKRYPLKNIISERSITKPLGTQYHKNINININSINQGELCKFLHKMTGGYIIFQSQK